MKRILVGMIFAGGIAVAGVGIAPAHADDNPYWPNQTELGYGVREVGKPNDSFGVREVGADLGNIGVRDVGKKIDSVGPKGAN